MRILGCFCFVVLCWMLFQGINGPFAVNKRNGSVAVEKGNDRAGTAGHGQRAYANYAAAEKADDDAGAVTEDAAPFKRNSAVGAVFDNPGNAVVRS